MTAAGDGTLSDDQYGYNQTMRRAESETSEWAAADYAVSAPCQAIVYRYGDDWKDGRACPVTPTYRRAGRPLCAHHVEEFDNNGGMSHAEIYWRWLAAVGGLSTPETEKEAK